MIRTLQLFLHYCNIPIYKHDHTLILSTYASMLTLSIPVYSFIKMSRASMCTAPNSFLGGTVSSRTFELGAVTRGLAGRHSERERGLTSRTFLDCFILWWGSTLKSGFKEPTSVSEGGPPAMLRSPDPAASQGVEWALRHVGVKNCLDFCCEFKILFRLCVVAAACPTPTQRNRELLIFIGLYSLWLGLLCFKIYLSKPVDWAGPCCIMPLFVCTMYGGLK